MKINKLWEDINKRNLRGIMAIYDEKNCEWYQTTEEEKLCKIETIEENIEALKEEFEIKSYVKRTKEELNDIIDEMHGLYSYLELLKEELQNLKQ